MTNQTLKLDTVTCADVFDFLKPLPDESVNCVVTSPPYWKQRDYNVAGQIGLEPTVQEYVATLVRLFHEVYRVLRKDGTLWLNLGDTYANDQKLGGHSAMGKQAYLADHVKATRQKYSSGLPPKSLIMVPARVAIAMQDDGWVLRNDIIWHKPSVMPESVTDRLTSCHEHIFLFVKSDNYWFDQDAIREKQTGGTHSRGKGTSKKGITEHDGFIRNNASYNESMTAYTDVPGGRNSRDVWTIQSQRLKHKHYAAFPMELAERCISAGCPATVCSECQAPYVRIIEKESIPEAADWLPYEGKHASQDDQASHKRILGNIRRLRAAGRDHDNPLPKRITVGWQPTCKCGADTEKGIVLDPFMGSGTVALKARELGRHYIGCDLDVTIANERLAEAYTPPLFIE